MSYAAYLFDFDYTLADSSRGIVMCFRHVLEHNGYADVTDDAIRRTIGKTLEESFALLTGVDDPARLAAFKAEYRREADVHMTPNTRLFPETLHVLRTLKEGGARVGIISTKYRFRIHELLDQHLPADFLDIVVGGEDVTRAKPAPEGLLLAIERLGVEKTDVLYVGDSTVDAETARAAGVDFAGVTHGVTTADELAAYPHRRIMASLDELLDEDEKTPHPTARRRIAVHQVLILALLLWIACEESFPLDDDPTYLFFLFFLAYLLRVLRTRRVLPPAAKQWLRTRCHPLIVRCRALHIRQIRGKTPVPLSTQPCTCRNCGHTFTGNFCPRCGQTRSVYRFRLKHAPGNILRSLFRVDGKFGRTLVALLYRPGHLMRDFMQGRRASHSMPLQTLFLLVAFYLLAVQLVIPQIQTEKPTVESDSMQVAKLRESIADLQEDSVYADDTLSKAANELAIALLQKELTQKLHTADSLAAADQSDLDELSQAARTLAGETKLSHRLEAGIRSVPFLNRVWELLKRWSHGNRTLHVVATLPLLAIATLWAFQSRRRLRRCPPKVCFNLMEHFFIQAYIAGQIMLVSILLLPIGLTAYADDLFALPWWAIFLLFWWDFRQLYLCSWWESFGRTLLMFVYALLLLIGIVMFVLLLIAAAESLL